MTNLFAYRSTDPGILETIRDPVGPENDSTLVCIARDAGIVVAAWGAFKGVHISSRRVHVFSLLREAFEGTHKTLQCLEKTKGGHPKHPGSSHSAFKTSRRQTCGR
jgi:hypothetical protein